MMFCCSSFYLVQIRHLPVEYHVLLEAVMIMRPKSFSSISTFLSDVVVEHFHPAHQLGLPVLPRLYGCSGDLGLSTTSLEKSYVWSSKHIAALKVPHTNEITNLRPWMSQTMRLDMRFGSPQNPSHFILFPFFDYVR